MAKPQAVTTYSLCPFSRPLTAKTALMFEAALDVPADSLMYLQTKYNMQTARKDSSLFDMLKKIRKIAAVF